MRNWKELGEEMEEYGEIFIVARTHIEHVRAWKTMRCNII